MNTGKSMIRNLPLIIFIILIVGCGPATEAPQAKVEVTKITESNLVTGEIMQSKIFNQCDSANSIKLQIQFGDNVNETNQEELVLGAGITGGADVSGVAKLEIQGSVEKHFSSSTNVGANHQESVDIEIPAYTRQEYTIIWKETRREGTVEYMENGETKVTNFSYRVGLEFASSSVKNIDCSLPTETPPPVVPTPLPVSDVSLPLQTGTLTDGCINPQTWKPVSADQNTLNNITVSSNNCYSMEALGIFTDPQGVLHLFKRDKRNFESAGIYTPIDGNNSIVEFSIYINSMSIANSESPVYITFAVAPVNTPASAQDSARFKFNVDTTGNNPAILFMMADVGENSGIKITTQHYEYSRTYDIRFELVGGLMRVYINDFRMDESLSIPDGPKVFYIGYNLPALAGMDAEITNIHVDGAIK
jgi:hypothetical protein